ncbi:hypothetical protein CKAH01_08639 [Colletotrichum kahawae]|uniref:Uncharacterized protein n=1 Tax=Colletotrichum kahawae TaxID=34407 RepID=A0AAD9Y387_COLKA|nr:hypothetical protein CKAH01_08639 [Colletotrichum kahawae]
MADSKLPKSINEYAHPEQIPSSEEVERLEKMIDMLSDLQSLNPHLARKLKLHERIAMSKPESRFVRKQYDYFDCVAALSPEPLALFPDGSDNTSTGSHCVFASQNPRRDEDEAKQQEQQRLAPAQPAPTEYTGLQPQITLPQIDGCLVPDSTDSSSIIKFTYRLLAKKDWEQRSNNSIFQYCQDLLSLLKRFHGAASKSDERFYWMKLLHDLA